MGFAFAFLSSLDVFVLRSGVRPVRLDLVGEQRPASPGALARAAVQAAAPEPVAAFQLREPALGADAVAAEPPLRPRRAGRGTPGAVHPLRGERGECLRR